MPVIDNISMSLAHKPKDLNDEMQSFIEGVEMTIAALVSVFSKYGMEAISPVLGDKFDYNLHHAISHVVTEDHPQGTVLQVMQSGYKIKDRLLRPAAVSVTKSLEK
jgi:molecular chaperone GrpE